MDPFPNAERPPDGANPPGAVPAPGPVPPVLTRLLEAVSDTVIALDRDWRFTYLNPQAVREAGQPLEELLGRTIWEKFPDLLGTAVEAQYRRAVDERAAVHFETRGVRTGRWLEVHAYPSPEGLLVYGRDVTDRKRAEEALRTSEERFQSFMDNSPALAWVKDEQGRFVYLNRSYERYFRTTLAERRGRTDFDFRPPELARRLREADRAALEAGRTLELTEDVPDPDGRPRHWQVFKFPFHDAAGTRYVGGMALDLTERKRDEERLQEYAQRLQSLSRRLLEVQEQERRHLARELHDEIGQALTGLKLALETEARRPDGRPRPGLGEARALVQDLMGRLRDLSLRLRPTMLDDLGLLPALLWHFQRFAAHTKVQVAFEHHGVDGRFPPEVETAAYRIVQEALTNAARHAGVAEVSVRLWCDRAVLGVQIEDRGAGFDPAGVRASADTGGLSGMQERATLLGAALAIDSRPGAGTRVTAEIPVPGDLRSGEGQQTPAGGEPLPPAGQRQTKRRPGEAGPAS